MSKNSYFVSIKSPIKCRSQANVQNVISFLTISTSMDILSLHISNNVWRNSTNFDCNSSFQLLLNVQSLHMVFQIQGIPQKQESSISPRKPFHHVRKTVIKNSRTSAACCNHIVLFLKKISNVPFWDFLRRNNVK